MTLGCSKNIFDSEVLMNQLKANNFDVEHEAKQDDSINVLGDIRTLLTTIEGHVERIQEIRANKTTRTSVAASTAAAMIFPSCITVAAESW